MKVETLVILLFSIVLAGLISWLPGIFSARKEELSLADEMESRKKEQMPNNFIKYSGECEERDTTEYKKIIDKDVINILRQEERE